MSESKNARIVRLIAGIIGVVSIFLAWESVNIGSIATIGVSLVTILQLSQDVLLTLGAVAFVIGTLVLFIHPVGAVGQLIGLIIVCGKVLGMMDSTGISSIGLGAFAGILSCVLGGISYLADETSEEPENPSKT